MVRGRALLRRGPAGPPVPPPDPQNSTTQKTPTRKPPPLLEHERLETVVEDDEQAQENKHILPNKKSTSKKLIKMLTIMVRGRAVLRRGPARPPAPPPDPHNSSTQKNPARQPHLPQRERLETIMDNGEEAQENKYIITTKKT